MNESLDEQRMDINLAGAINEIFDLVTQFNSSLESRKKFGQNSASYAEEEFIKSLLFFFYYIKF